jgi:hypothetical protein
MPPFTNEATALTGGRPAISCVIPVYRAAPVLPELYRRVRAILTDENQTFEIIFVEDCGGDRSWEIISALAGADPRVRGFCMSRNYGQHNAILCGIREARGDIIITMDDDLQHPPEELPKLLAKLAEGFDVVYGPASEKKHGGLRNLASMVTKWVLQEAIGAETARQVCALRAFRTELRGAFANYQSSYVNIDVLLTWATTNFCAVPVDHEPRRQGESGYTTRNRFRRCRGTTLGTGVRVDEASWKPCCTEPRAVKPPYGDLSGLDGLSLGALRGVREVSASDVAIKLAFGICVRAADDAFLNLAVCVDRRYLGRGHTVPIAPTPWRARVTERSAGGRIMSCRTPAPDMAANMRRRTSR